MKTIIIEREVLKTEEKQYLQIPFELENDMEIVDITYHYQRYDNDIELNCIDFALIDATGMLIGAAGSNRSDFTFSEKCTSDGFLKKGLTKGMYSIVLGAYKVEDKGVSVTYTIRCKEKKEQLFFGDLHMHSTASDGKNTPQQLVELAKGQGLDFIFISDHNAYTQNQIVINDSKVAVYPASELTLYRGHFGVLGKEAGKRHPFSITDEDNLNTYLEPLRDSHLVIANHPDCDYCKVDFDLEKINVQAWELYNGGTTKGANERILERWHQALCEGKKIVAVGGSDFHFDDPFRTIGMPCNGVYSRSNELGDIVDALKKGNSFITLGKKGASVRMKSATATMGGVVECGENVQITCEGVNQYDRIYIITNQQKEMFQGITNGTFEHTKELTHELFVRVEMERYIPYLNQYMRILISNPIYVDRKEGAL